MQSLEFSTIHIPPAKIQKYKTKPNKKKKKEFCFLRKGPGKGSQFCQWENSLKVDNFWIIQKYTFYN